MKHEVTSSVFSHVEYVPAEKSLLIDFHSGYTYEYLNVPNSIIEQLLNSESKGKYFNKTIRNNFKYIRR